MSKGNCTYIPATMPGIHLNQFKQLEKKAKRMWWWREEGFFQHSHLLISVYYGMYGKLKNGPTKNIRKNLGFPEDKILFGDSGGFQSQTLGKVVPNEDIFEWYENNCDYGFVQDFPQKYVEMARTGVRREWNDKDFLKRSAEFQAESNQEFLRQKFTKCKLYNVLHGENVQQMDFWFDTVKNDKMFGWASGQKPTEPFRIAFKLAYFYKKGIKKNIHIFAASGSTTIPLMVYATKYFDNITFDSSSWAVGDMYRSFINPMALGTKITIGDISSARYTKLPCSCPVCINIKNTRMMYDGKAISSNLISLHNLYWMLWTVDRWKELLGVEKDFKSTVYHTCSQEVTHAIEYLDEAIKDFEGANAKYWNQLNNKRGLFSDEEQRVDAGEEGTIDIFQQQEDEKKPKKKGKKEKKEKEVGVVKIETVENMEDYL